jgi:CDP-paratose 2-epimerase
MIRKYGINEERPIEFHSPYGCSKGAADQYVLDYARTFSLPTVVFRMSCIYGEHQFGTKDQGWGAHFLIQALEGKPITMYGDGMQVRDVLFAEDLVDAMILAAGNIDRISGNAFNIGGGPSNSVSLIELLDLISELRGDSCAVSFDNWRAADQRYYISDCRRFQEATGWQPQYDVRSGIAKLYRWLLSSRQSGPQATAAGEPNGTFRPRGAPMTARTM